MTLGIACVRYTHVNINVCIHVILHIVLGFVLIAAAAAETRYEEKTSNHIKLKLNVILF